MALVQWTNQFAMYSLCLYVYLRLCVHIYIVFVCLWCFPSNRRSKRGGRLRSMTVCMLARLCPWMTPLFQHNRAPFQINVWLDLVLCQDLASVWMCVYMCVCVYMWVYICSDMSCVRLVLTVTNVMLGMFFLVFLLDLCSTNVNCSFW